MSKYRGDPNMAAYIVAIADPVKAFDLTRHKVADLDDKIEDLGRVSDGLLIALKLQSGQSATIYLLTLSAWVYDASDTGRRLQCVTIGTDLLGVDNG